MPKKKKKVPQFNMVRAFRSSDKWAESVVQKMRELPDLVGKPISKVAKMIGISDETYKNICKYEYTSTTLMWSTIGVIERWHRWALAHPELRKTKKPRKKVVYLNVKENDEE